MRKIKGFNTVEFLLVVAIIGICIALQGNDSKLSLAKSKVSEAMALFSGARIDIELYHAFSGRWPQTGQLNVPVARYIGSMHWGKGAINMAFKEDAKLDGLNLTFRRLLPEKGEGPVSRWVCSRAPIPPGFRVMGKDQTDIATSNLPRVCNPKPLVIHQDEVKL